MARGCRAHAAPYISLRLDKLTASCGAPGQFSFPSRVPLSDEVKDLLGKMISVDPLQRATMADIQVPAHYPLCSSTVPQGARGAVDTLPNWPPSRKPGSQKALGGLSVRRRVQAHPWFKRDQPENLDLNKVNAAYLDLSSSRVAPDFAQRSQAVIERITKAVVDQDAAKP